MYSVRPTLMHNIFDDSLMCVSADIEPSCSVSQMSMASLIRSSILYVSVMCMPPPGGLISNVLHAVVVIVPPVYPVFVSLKSNSLAVSFSFSVFSMTSNNLVNTSLGSD